MNRISVEITGQLAFALTARTTGGKSLNVVLAELLLGEPEDVAADTWTRLTVKVGNVVLVDGEEAAYRVTRLFSRNGKALFLGAIDWVEDDPNWASLVPEDDIEEFPQSQIVAVRPRR